MIYIRDWLLLIAAGLSNLLLIDALYKLRKVVKGVFAVDTWQMILHVSAYTLVFINGIIMLGLAYNAKKNFKGLSYASTNFYKGYNAFIILIFISQLPFSYIIYRLID